MKKVIRLTESDLIRIVKRVINEQDNSGRTKLSEPIHIKVNQNGTVYYFDLTEVVPHIKSCFFYGTIRGGDPTDMVQMQYGGDVPKNMVSIQMGNTNIEGGSISSKAAEMLENACGNDQYASMNKGGSSNYV